AALEAAPTHATRALEARLVVEPREARDLPRHVGGGCGHLRSYTWLRFFMRAPPIAARIGACKSTSSAALPRGPTRWAPSRGTSSRRTAGGSCSTAGPACCHDCGGSSPGRDWT